MIRRESVVRDAERDAAGRLLVTYDGPQRGHVWDVTHLVNGGPLDTDASVFIGASAERRNLVAATSNGEQDFAEWSNPLPVRSGERVFILFTGPGAAGAAPSDAFVRLTYVERPG